MLYIMYNKIPRKMNWFTVTSVGLLIALEFNLANAYQDCTYNLNEFLF